MSLKSILLKPVNSLKASNLKQKQYHNGIISTNDNHCYLHLSLDLDQRLNKNDSHSQNDGKNIMSNAIENSLRKIPTENGTYIISWQPDMLKLLIRDEKMKPLDLLFSTRFDRKKFAQELFLLALQDTLSTNTESPLAQFARSLMTDQWH